jgi:hypothetical protein
MEIDQAEISFLLTRMALFKDFSKGELAYIASRLDILELPKDERIFTEGDNAEGFYIIYSGRVRVSRQRQGQEEVYALLDIGDHFGEEGLLLGRPRPVSVTAVEPTRLLRISAKRFYRLIEKNPLIRSRLLQVIESRQLTRKKNVSWLGDDETIYLFTRKDKAYMIVSLVPPALLGLLGIFFTWLLFTTPQNGFTLVGEWVSALFIALSILWGIWEYVDWTNDYYIVTNQRVIWIEKVVALYESRQEAPMDTVLTVGVNTDLIGRILKYGDVRVKTFTGQIVMRHVDNPEFMLALIEEFLARTKIVTKRTETAALERAIRVRLGLRVPPEKPPSPLAKPSLRSTNPGQNPFRFITDIFKVRYEEGTVVTYRKHWILLFARAWKPSLLLVLLFTLFVLRFVDILPILSIFNFLLVWFSMLTVAVIWWLYEYVDWRNDIYQITEDQIIDIYRKPLGEVDQKSAALENILSLHHEQTGLIRLLLNYGDVIAMVGSARFTFDGVFNPADVQQDIFLRMNARKRRQREADASRERDRVADWMAAYHRQAESLRRLENPNNSDQKSG